ncbi:MAG TPA: TerC family protein [Bacillota bacterium]|nr:TerC family protein [Bacillota bacterium]
MSLILAVFSIVLIDLVLSGDNAAVIGLAIKNLPHEQRKTAAMFGAGGAIVLRIIFTSIATLLINVPYLNAIGGALLLWITWNLLKQDDGEEHVNAANKFWAAVGSIILADVSMAFDNIMGVAGAAHGSIYLVIFGLALSIPILVWGSNWLATLMNTYPIIIYIGGAVLAHTSLNMLFHDHGLNMIQFVGKTGADAISWSFAMIVLTYGLFKTKLISLPTKK